jgi:hypothetical protein
MRRLDAAVLAAGVAWGTANATDSPRGSLLMHAGYRPAAVALAAEDRDYLGYAIDQLPRVQRIDIDDDGIPDSFVIGADTLCGTGGCPVLLLDGRSGHRLGEFFGAVAVLRQRAGARAVIQVISRRDIDHSNLETHVFDSGRYRRADHVVLDAAAVAEWRKGIEQRP